MVSRYSVRSSCSEQIEQWPDRNFNFLLNARWFFLRQSLASFTLLSMEALARDVERICQDADKAYSRLEEALALRDRQLFVLERRMLAVRLTVSRLRPNKATATVAGSSGASARQVAIDPAQSLKKHQETHTAEGRDTRAPLLPLNSFAVSPSVSAPKLRQGRSATVRATSAAANVANEQIHTSQISFPVTVERSQAASVPVRLFRWADRGYRFLVPRSRDAEDAAQKAEKTSIPIETAAGLSPETALKRSEASIPDWNGILAQAPPVPAEKLSPARGTAAKAVASRGSVGASSNPRDLAMTRKPLQSVVPRDLPQAECPSLAPRDDSLGLIEQVAASKAGPARLQTPKRTVRFADPEVQMPSHVRHQQALVPSRQRIVTAPAFRQRP
jgi:hypothetical protein